MTKPVSLPALDAARRAGMLARDGTLRYNQL